MSYSDPMLKGRDPAQQSLARTLTPAEIALAEALERIFATGVHDFEKVAAQLAADGVARPSGAAEAWTLAVLQQEIDAINASLDAAYATVQGAPGAAALDA